MANYLMEYIEIVKVELEHAKYSENKYSILLFHRPELVVATLNRENEKLTLFT